MMCLLAICMVLHVDSVAGDEIPRVKSATALSPRKELWQTVMSPSRRIVVDGLPNVGKLNDHLWRSGQPTRKGLEQLSELLGVKIKTVVNLRQESEVDKTFLAEINYIPILMPDEHAPTEANAQKFLDVVSNPDNWPILVHCKGGQGRTGVMSAIVRYSFDGWDHKKIMEEMNNFRISHLGLIKTRMAGPQLAFIENWERTHTAGEYRDKVQSRTTIIGTSVGL